MKKFFEWLYFSFFIYVDVWCFFTILTIKSKIKNTCIDCDGTGIFQHPHEDLKWKCSLCSGTGKYVKPLKDDWVKVDSWEEIEEYTQQLPDPEYIND
jgi:hypothetical protein